jgi:hypothetical protein
MKNIMKSIALLFLLVSGFSNANTLHDTVVINTSVLSNSGMRAILNSISPGPSVEMITNKNDIILYYAEIGIINPTKKKYAIKITCVDTTGNVIIKGSFQRELSSELKRNIGTDLMKSTLFIVTLDPKVGAMAPGQLIPLKSHNEYYIKLFVENKLIGISHFNYEVEP